MCGFFRLHRNWLMSLFYWFDLLNQNAKTTKQIDLNTTKDSISSVRAHTHTHTIHILGICTWKSAHKHLHVYMALLSWLEVVIVKTWSNKQKSKEYCPFAQKQSKCNGKRHISFIIVSESDAFVTAIALIRNMRR